MGIISDRPADFCRSMIQQMLSSSADAKSCSTGTWSNEELGLYVGWACHPGSFNDCLPVRNEREDCWLVISGEVFPRPDHIAGLRAKGHATTALDANYLIHLYEEEGIDFLNGLNGLFSGVLADCRSGKCYLFTDRYGVNRVFVHENNMDVYFASHPAPILAVIPATREFDFLGLAEWMTCGCTIGDRSLFRDISILPGAALCAMRKGRKMTRHRYFMPAEWESRDRADPKLFNELVESIFPSVTRRYARANLPVGISLTAGIDTRMVISALDTQAVNYPCYTFSGMYRDTFDVLIARRVAESCGLSHDTIFLGEEFLRSFPESVEASVRISGGYLGMTGAASLYVNAKARKIAPIKLTGNIGGELFRGVRAFKSRIPRARFYEPALDPLLADAVRSFKKLEQQDPISFAIFLQAPNLGYGVLSVEDSQLITRTPFLDNELVQMAYEGPRSYASGLDLCISIIHKNRKDLMDIPTDSGRLGTGGRLAKSLRRKYYRFLFKGEYWSSRGLPNWAAALFHFLPWLSPEGYFVGRHKYQQFPIWTRRQLADYLRSVLLENNRLPECLDRQGLSEMVEQHLSGRSNYLDELDKALTVALSYKLLLSNGDTGSPPLSR